MFGGFEWNRKWGKNRDFLQIFPLVISSPPTRPIHPPRTNFTHHLIVNVISILPIVLWFERSKKKKNLKIQIKMSERWFYFSGSLPSQSCERREMNWKLEFHFPPLLSLLLHQWQEWKSFCWTKKRDEHARVLLVRVAAQKKLSCEVSLKTELLWLMRSERVRGSTRATRNSSAKQKMLFTLNTMTNIYNWIIFCLCSLLNLRSGAEWTKHSACLVTFFSVILSALHTILLCCCWNWKKKFGSTRHDTISYLSLFWVLHSRQTSCIIIISKCK